MYDELAKRLRETSCGAKDTLWWQAADAIEQLEKALNAVNDAHNEGYDVGYWAGRRDYEPRWIPVMERLPENDQDVLVMVHWRDYPENMMCYGRKYKTRWYLWNGELGELINGFDITHWMPLPQPPKEE